jgi:hypothetical protein
MCERLWELRQGLSRLAAGFDPRLLSADDAARVVADASAIEKIAAALKALAATRVAESGRWRREGARSAAHHLARTTGTSVAKAAEALETARRMRSLPEVSAAVRCGELSAEQAAAVADAASADPGAEGRLVAEARSAPWGSSRTAVPPPRRPSTTPRAAGGASTPGATCAPTATGRGRSVCTCATCPRPGPSSWRPSSPSAGG